MTTILLPPELLKTLCSVAADHMLPPDELVRLAAGIPPHEPFLLSRTAISGRKEVCRFLQILSMLYKQGREQFEKVAPMIHGNKRKYFGRSVDEVSSTGKSNRASNIPNSSWYVSTDNDGSRKATIVYRLMRAMHFSSNYSSIVSSLCYSENPVLPFPYQLALYKLQTR